MLVQIAEEFRPNGGSTLRDSIDRIEAKVNHHSDLRDRLVLVEERQRMIVAAAVSALRSADGASPLNEQIAAALERALHD